MSESPTQTRVAVVTGGSKGVGQGIAVGLAEAGWTVHVTGRRPERLAETVAAADGLPGRVIAHVCDHAEDQQIVDLLATLQEAAPIDLLVNNVWAGPRYNHAQPEKFWQRPVSDWDLLVGVGLRSHYVAAHAVVPLMVERGSGVIVNITSIGARAYLHSTLYGMAKAALDKMTNDMATELKGTGVTVVSLWPGLVRTKQLVASGLTEFAGVSIDDTETPELQGRVIAALVDSPDLASHAGAALITAEIADELGVLEPGGARPVSPRVMFGEGPLFRAIGG